VKLPKPEAKGRPAAEYAHTLEQKGQLFLTPEEKRWLHERYVQQEIDKELSKLDTKEKP
jgi:hypothetical protein